MDGTGKEKNREAPEIRGGDSLKLTERARVYIEPVVSSLPRRGPEDLMETGAGIHPGPRLPASDHGSGDKRETCPAILERFAMQSMEFFSFFIFFPSIIYGSEKFAKLYI
jgi:hypothetical protein